jgi:hypothetical protein
VLNIEHKKIPLSFLKFLDQEAFSALKPNKNKLSSFDDTFKLLLKGTTQDWGCMKRTAGWNQS